MFGYIGLFFGVCFLAYSTTTAALDCTGTELTKFENDAEKFRKAEYVGSSVTPLKMVCDQQLTEKAADHLKMFTGKEVQKGATRKLEEWKGRDTYVAFTGFPRNDKLDDKDYYYALTFATNIKFGLATLPTPSGSNQKQFVLGLFEHEPVQVTELREGMEAIKETLNKLPASSEDPEFKKLREDFSDKFQEGKYDLSKLDMLKRLDFRGDHLLLKAERTELIKKQQAAASQLSNADLNKLLAVQLQYSKMEPFRSVRVDENTYNRITHAYICGIVPPDAEFYKQMNQLYEQVFKDLAKEGAKVDPKLANPPGELDSYDFSGEITHSHWMFWTEKPHLYTLTQIIHMKFCQYNDYDEVIINDLVLADPDNCRYAKANAQAPAEKRSCLAKEKDDLLAVARAAIMRDVALTGKLRDAGNYQKGLRVRLYEDSMLDYCLLQRPIAYMDLNHDKAVCENKPTNELKELKLKCAMKLKESAAWQSVFADNGITTLDIEVTKDLLKQGYNMETLEKPSFARALAIRYCKDQIKDASHIGRITEDILTKQEADWKLPKSKATPAQISSWMNMLRQYLPGAIEYNVRIMIGHTDYEKVQRNVEVELDERWGKALEIQNEIAALLKKQPPTTASRKQIVVRAYRFCLAIRPHSFLAGVNEEQVCKQQLVNTELIALVDCAKASVRAHGAGIDLAQFEFTYYLVKTLCPQDALFKKKWLGAQLINKLFKGGDAKVRRKGVAKDYAQIINGLKAVDQFWQERADAAVLLTKEATPTVKK